MNRKVLKIFGPILILAGILGFITPPELSLMSGASPYNVFHIISGMIGIAIAFQGSASAVRGFNIVFGIIDLYQFAANYLNLFPKEQFLWKPADDILHLVIGLALVIIGLTFKD